MESNRTSEEKDIQSITLKIITTLCSDQEKSTCRQETKAVIERQKRELQENKIGLECHIKGKR